MRVLVVQSRLDKFCAVLGGFLPVGIIVGNVGYESMMALIGLVWVARSIMARENPFPWLLRQTPALQWLLVVLTIWTSLAINGPGHKGLLHDLVFIRHFLFLCAICDISRRIPLARYFLMGMAASVALAGLNILLAHASGMDLMGKPLARYYSKVKEATRIAGVFSFVAPAFIAWSISLPLLSRRVKHGMFGLGLAATLMLLFVGVRIALISTLCGFGFWAIYLLFKRFSRKALPYLIPIILLISGLITLYLSQQNWASVHHRVSMYKVTWAMVLENPVFGVGVSGYQDAYKKMAASGKVEPYVAPDGRVWHELEASHAHSLVLMILACTGVVGLLVFGWLFLKVVRIAFTRSEPHWRSGLVIWPVVFLVNGLTGWSIFEDWYHAWFAYLVALTWVVSSVDNPIADTPRSVKT